MRGYRVLAVTLALAFAFAGGAAAAPDGAAIYHHCASCHKATGTGDPGVFPPLAAHAAKLEAASRTYPIDVVLFGLTGEIRVEGKTYKGRMPAYEGLLSDAEIAAVLDYVLSSWGNDKALPAGYAKITAADVSARRAAKLTPEQVYLAREKLSL